MDQADGKAARKRAEMARRRADPEYVATERKRRRADPEYAARQLERERERRRTDPEYVARRLEQSRARRERDRERRRTDPEFAAKTAYSAKRIHPMVDISVGQVRSAVYRHIKRFGDRVDVLLLSAALAAMAASGRCSCCDRPFGTEIERRPSIDRVDSARGYDPGNVAAICFRCNTIKNSGTAADHQRIVDYMRRHGAP